MELLTSEANPLLEGLRLRRRPEPCVVVIYGASGDLASRKLIPALYALGLRQLLPEKFAILGVARSEGSDESFRAEMMGAVERFGRDGLDSDVWARMVQGLFYLPADPASERVVPDRCYIDADAARADGLRWSEGPSPDRS